MTPEEAIALEPGTTPGPWTASECTGFIAAAEGERPVLTAERGDWWCEEDHRLAAAAPDMRATIATQTWEYGVQVETSPGNWILTGSPWEPSREDAEAEMNNPNVVPSGWNARLVRRPVGPVEVVEDDWP